MAEERMKLFSTQKEGPTLSPVKFSFVIQSTDKGECRSPVFDIYDIAEIQFFLKCHKYHDEKNYFIQVRKATLGKELGIKLLVVCKTPKYNSNLECTENWSEWQNMGLSETTFFDVEITVIMSKIDSMALKLYTDEEFTDFQLSTAKGSVSVHKAQMAGYSEVFKTMLSREWKETHEGCINMEGVTLQTLQGLKDHMYLGALPGDKLCPLLLIARCYLMDNLKADCLTKLTQTVTSENLFDILEFSFFIKFPELTFAILKAMSKSMVEDAHKNMMENDKSCKKVEAGKPNQEQSNEETKQEQSDEETYE